jgi:hypothetical protein
MTCSEKVKIGAIKDFICAPVQLSKRSYIINEFDRAWQNLQNEDGAVLQYAAKRTEIMKAQNSDFDPNEFPIPFSFLQKILNNTSFNHLIQQAAPYGKRGELPSLFLTICSKLSIRFPYMVYPPGRRILSPSVSSTIESTSQRVA